MTHYSDRSRYECGMKCPRKRYWNYHYAGKGIVPVGSRFDLEFGKAVHYFIETGHQKGGAAYLIVDDGNQLTPDGLEQWDEINALYYGLTETYRRFTLPRIEEKYEWVGKEVEMTMDLDGIKWMSRLDGVLRRRSDQLYFLLEAKTTSYMEDLAAGSATNFQLLMEMEAMRRHYSLEPEQVGGALLLAFAKGSKRRASKKEQEMGRDGYRRISPFTYHYSDGLSAQLDYTSRKGWKLWPTWTIPDWYEKTVGQYPDQVKAQVQLWPSVSFDEGRFESVLAQVKSVEMGVHGADYYQAEGPFDIDQYWPQNFANCANDGGFRRPCPYQACCFQPRTAKDPVATGEYEWRVANHKQETVDVTEVVV